MPNVQDLSHQLVRNSLLEHGFSSDIDFDYNLPAAVLVEKALAQKEG